MEMEDCQKMKMEDWQKEVHDNFFAIRMNLTECFGFDYGKHNYGDHKEKDSLLCSIKGILATRKFLKELKDLVKQYDKQIVDSMIVLYILQNEELKERKDS